MKIVLKILLRLVGALLGFFLITFPIYFFNLDMKFTSLLEPILLKHYDSIPRKQYL